MNSYRIRQLAAGRPWAGAALLLALAALPALAAAPSFDAATAPLDTALPLDPAIRAGQLDNGLTYFVRRNGKPEKRAELRLAVNAGAVLEDDDQRGLAHFLEHMAFNGTRDLPKHELVDFLQRIGMRFGADLNAFTAFDETVYQLTVPTDDPAQLRQGLPDPRELGRRGELRPRGDREGKGRGGRGMAARPRSFPAGLRQGAAAALRAARATPTGCRSAPRKASTSANRDKLMRFYRDWYRPDLMAVVVVGDVDPAAVEAKIKTTFGKIPKRDGKPRPSFEVPSSKETLVTLVQDPELPITQIGINFKHPADSEGGVGDYRRGLVETLYHAMFNARLAEIAQGPNPPFIMARSQDDSFVRPLVVYSLDAVVHRRHRPEGHGGPAARGRAGRRQRHRGAVDVGGAAPHQRARSMCCCCAMRRAGPRRRTRVPVRWSTRVAPWRQLAGGECGELRKMHATRR